METRLKGTKNKCPLRPCGNTQGRGNEREEQDLGLCLSTKAVDDNCEHFAALSNEELQLIERLPVLEVL